MVPLIPLFDVSPDSFYPAHIEELQNSEKHLVVIFHHPKYRYTML